MPILLKKRPKQLARPFVKWAGGKRQLIREINQRIPAAVNRYFEPFIGGGAVFFSNDFKAAVIGDVNAELINAYQVIKNKVELLIASLKKHRPEKDYFYLIRALDPARLDPVEKAGRFIFLNKTCFNGLYRVNKNGLFNVPFGRYKNPLICDAENLSSVSHRLQNVEIKCAPFDVTVSAAEQGDFVYFDPPYMPLSETANFVSYDKNGFTGRDQIRLRDIFRELSYKGVKCMLSNSYTEPVRELYADFNISVVNAARAVNCKAAGRGKIKEVLITNYETVS